MITYKSSEEIKKLQKAGRIVALTHQEIQKHIAPGVSTAQLDRICEKFIRSQGAYPSFKGLYGFPGSVCVSVNDTLVHGIPSENIVLKEGDIVTIDIGACVEGYHGDSAWTYPVGKISKEAQDLLDVTKQSLFEGLKMAKAGNRLGDVSNAIQSYVEAHGYSIVREFTGHGVGKAVHEDPMVPNYGQAGHGILLKPGLVIAIEPMVNAGSREVVTLLDDWTTVTKDGKLCAHYEHTVAITPNGDCLILTSL